MCTGGLVGASGRAVGPAVQQSIFKSDSLNPLIEDVSLG